MIPTITRLKHCAVLALLLAAVSVQPAAAQYFGQNKVQYRTFDFKVLKTEHFDIYYYPEEEAAVREAARMAERWYVRLSRVLEHQLSGRQPLVLYASHPHFEQTNVIEGMLGEGTGGVTEGLKRRIVMPIGGGLAETDHVLGHELVHAFQYDILGPNINLPLWFIEGMAEYLSIGSSDPHTAVWLRDAALNERLPALKDLSGPDYFPYRFGHAFWAYVGGRWGDPAVANVLHAAAGPRSSPGSGSASDPVELIERVLEIDDEEFSKEWHQSVLATMLRPLGDRSREAGRRVIEPRDERELNIGPALSPDGSRIAFLSSRDRLSLDLFVADAGTGRIQRKLISTAADPHFDSLQFISSAGAWDPSGRVLAVAAIRGGKPVIALFDVESGDRQREIEIAGADEVFHPAWSPDGRRLAFSALSGGHSDLWVAEVESGAARKLTNDPFADLQPSWAPDGERLVFVSDRFTTTLDNLALGQYQLAILNVKNAQPSALRTFAATRHNSPQWSRDGSIYFIAYAEGIPDVYRVSGDSPANGLGAGGTPTRLTRLITGATAITTVSPALAVSADGSRAAVVVYRNFTYEIHALEGAQLRAPEQGPARTEVAAGQLAPAERRDAQVDRLLDNPTLGLPAEEPAAPEDYDAKLALDYVGQQFGVSTNNYFGGYVSGGIGFSFSDVLGNHTVSTVLQVNGGLDDFGGQVAYLNRTRRWNWGAAISQVPYVTGGVLTGFDTVNGQQVLVEQLVRDRQIDRRVLGVVQYPFSRGRRIEFGASARHLTFNRQIDERGFSLNTGEILFEDSQKTPLGEPVTLGEVTGAFVQDTSVFGATGPILGHRSRFEVSPAFGDLRFTNVTADARHYVMPFTPVTIAGRLQHYGRYGSDAESPLLSPLFVGFPGLVRGYDIGSFDFDDCVATTIAGCSTINEFVGSRLLVAGVEVRAPIVGLFKGELDYGPVPAELIAFFDAGVAWDGSSQPSGLGDGSRPWARSFGAGVRVNVFGYLIAELAGVRALDRGDDRWRFVFNLQPGF